MNTVHRRMAICALTLFVLPAPLWAQSQAEATESNDEQKRAPPPPDKPTPPAVETGSLKCQFTLLSVRYSGGPIPPCAHVETRSLKALVITGAVTSAGMWSLTAILGLLGAGSDSAYGTLAIPLGGPLAYAAILTGRSGACLDGSACVLTWTEGITFTTVQVTGLALLFAGLFVKRQFLVWDVATSNADTQVLHVSLLPSLGGANLVAAF